MSSTTTYTLTYVHTPKDDDSYQIELPVGTFSTKQDAADKMLSLATTHLITFPESSLIFVSAWVHTSPPDLPLVLSGTPSDSPGSFVTYFIRSTP